MDNNSMKIRLSDMKQIREFSAAVSRFPEDISLSCGKTIVNAKSIMGIFSLDLRCPLTVTVDSEEPEKILSALSRFCEESGAE